MLGIKGEMKAQSELIVLIRDAKLVLPSKCVLSYLKKEHFKFAEKGFKFAESFKIAYFSIKNV